MKKIVSILLIVIGIMLMLTPFITEQIVKYNSKSIINEHISPKIIKDNNQNEHLETKFDYSAVEDVDIKTVIKASLNFDKKLVIGTLLIPSLDINLPIMKGLSHANLLAGAATMKPGQSFGLGNFTLAGHHMKNKDLLFGSLMDIEIEDIVYVSDGEYVYEYTIYDTVVVPDTDMDMLSDEKSDKEGSPIISLMTCYFSSSTGKRFFALGKLRDKYPVE